jgi:preprotein translocase subunit SecG
MIYLITAVHIIVCLFLIGVVLLQTGKRADLAGAFGGGGSQTAFGTRGAATFLTKITTTFAVLFMMTTISLSVVSFRTTEGGSGSVLDNLPAAATAPAVDGGDATPPVDDGSGDGADGDTPAEGVSSDDPATETSTDDPADPASDDAP